MIFTANEIARAKELAEINFIKSSEIGDVGMVHFMFNGVKIINPWMDEDGAFDLTDAEAINTYGLINVLNFIVNILKEVK